MNKKKILVGCYIAFFSCVNLTACGDASLTFDNWSISEDGILDWNDIKDAKYYCCKLENESSDVWLEESKIDLKTIFDGDNEIKKFEIYAFTSQNSIGKIDINPIKDRIVFAGKKFYKYDEAPTYTVNIVNSITNENIKKNKTYSDVLITDFVSYSKDINTKVDNIACYDVDGFYLDSSFSKKVDKDLILDSNLTLYAKIVERSAKISFTYTIGAFILDTGEEFKTLNCDYTKSFKLGDIELPTVDGASFSHWSGYKDVEKEDLPTIKGCEADENYRAIYYEDINIIFINKPYQVELGGSYDSEDHSDYIEYGAITTKFKGELTETTLKRYLSGTFSKYYVSYHNYYDWPSTYKSFLRDKCDAFTSSVIYEETSGDTIYVWGSND